jgi:hypothetical protein
MKKLQELHTGMILVKIDKTGGNYCGWDAVLIRQGELKSRDY